jgi:Uma2 family endonuclease
MIVAAPAVRRWTRDEYYKMAEAGVFAPGERVELIEGEIIAMTPQKSRHTAAIGLAQDALRVAFGSGFHVRSQGPLALDAHSEPEPDIAVVRGTPRDYVEDHPKAGVLVAEISDTTLAFDRGRKAAVYARAGIPEYWIVNLVDRVLEVHRDPGPLPHAPAEYGYRSILRLGPTETANPLHAPAATIRIADLLP